jgi:hypothetical protein
VKIRPIRPNVQIPVDGTPVLDKFSKNIWSIHFCTEIRKRWHNRVFRPQSPGWLLSCQHRFVFHRFLWGAHNSYWSHYWRNPRGTLVFRSCLPQPISLTPLIRHCVYSFIV